MTVFIKKHKDTIIRIIIQIISFVLFSQAFANTLLSVKKIVAAIAGLALGQQASLTSGQQAGSLVTPLLVLAATVPATVLLGRYYCGYICSIGALQDFCFPIQKYLIKKNPGISKKTEDCLSKVKYLVLILILVSAVIGWNVDGFMGNPTALWTIVVVIGLVSAILYRPFCRYICPLGAIYSIASLGSFEHRKSNCAGDGHCCVCRYKCGKHKINYVYLVITILIFIIMNIVSTRMLTVNTSTENEKVEEAVSAAASESGPYTDGIYEASESGPYIDGIYEGVGEGFRGDIKVKVTIENGNIADISIEEYRDDDMYIGNAYATMIPKMQELQSAEVDGVSGATYSSRGLKEAVGDALWKAAGEVEQTDVTAEEPTVEQTVVTAEEPTDEQTVPENPLNLSSIEDGVYKGSANGFRGELQVEVTVKNHEIEKIQILSYYDNEEYLFRAAPIIFDTIICGQTLTLDAVSGATYSSSGLVNAVADALQIDDSQYEPIEVVPRKEKKHKKSMHVTQKFIQSEEEYNALIEKYKDVVYGPDGKKITSF